MCDVLQESRGKFIDLQSQTDKVKLGLFDLIVCYSPQPKSPGSGQHEDGSDCGLGLEVVAVGRKALGVLFSSMWRRTRGISSKAGAGRAHGESGAWPRGPSRDLPDSESGSAPHHFDWKSPSKDREISRCRWEQACKAQGSDALRVRRLSFAYRNANRDMSCQCCQASMRPWSNSQSECNTLRILRPMRLVEWSCCCWHVPEPCPRQEAGSLLAERCQEAVGIRVFEGTRTNC